MPGINKQIGGLHAGMVALCVILVIILHTLLLIFTKSTIEQDLILRVTNTLSAHGFKQIVVTAAGRDLLLHGSTSSAIERHYVTNLVAQISGVRIVQQKLEIKSSRLPYLVIRWINNRIKVEGELPTRQMVNTLVAEIKVGLGVQVVSNNISINPEVAIPKWFEMLLKSLKSLAILQKIKLTIGAGQFVVSGVLESDNNYPTLLTEIRQSIVTNQLKFINQIAILPAVASEFSLYYDNNRLILTGTLHAEKEHTMLRKVLRSITKSKLLDDRIQVIKTVPKSDWLKSIMKLNTVLNNILIYDFRINSDYILIHGKVDSRSQQIVLSRQVRNVLKKYGVGLRQLNLKFNIVDALGKSKNINITSGTNQQRTKSILTERTSKVDVEKNMTNQKINKLYSVSKEGKKETKLVKEKADKQTCQLALNKLVMQYNITFPSNSAQLAMANDHILDQLAQRLNNCQSLRIIIRGYTDSIGGDSKNKVLSLQRSEAVRVALISRKVSTKRLRAEGLGEEDPIGNNNTATGREKNRRIDIIVN